MLKSDACHFMKYFQSDLNEIIIIVLRFISLVNKNKFNHICNFKVLIINYLYESKSNF